VTPYNKAEDIIQRAVFAKVFPKAAAFPYNDIIGVSELRIATVSC
jgi:hypothetical protein